MNSELFIFKIVTAADWTGWKDSGTYAGSADDARDGFIHLSARGQVTGTLDKHFAGLDDLVLVMVDSAAIADRLRWEPSRGGDLFPHVYGDLPFAAVTGHTRLRIGSNGRHALPAGFDA